MNDLAVRLAQTIRCVAVAFFAIFLMCFIQKAQAHQFNFGSISITEDRENEYTVYFRYSAEKGVLEQSGITFPDSCLSNAVVNDRIAVNSISFNYTVQCQGPLVLSLHGVDLNSQIYIQYDGYLKGAHFERVVKSSVIDVAELKAEQGRGLQSNAKPSYFRMGVVHILSGIDHLMVVLCYVGIFGLGRRLIYVISSFTVGHSVTLILASLNYIDVYVPPIEACIALSIAFLARELWVPRQTGLTFVLAGLIGLIHGLGFASALSETLSSMGSTAAFKYSWLDILRFNIGVEAGQIMFIVGCLVVWVLSAKLMPDRLKSSAPYQVLHAHGRVVSSIGIGGAAVFMLLERVLPWFS